jgi:D-alanyl-lipoteichoic acid acyltransferase DltB (MBOAT superfamily)
MLFHSWTFLVFLAVVLPVFFALRRTRFWIPWLLLASYGFYAWWNPYYLILVFYSTALDYLLVTLMDHCPIAMGQDSDAAPPVPVLWERAGVRVISYWRAIGARNHPHPNPLPQCREREPERRDATLRAALRIFAALAGGAAAAAFIVPQRLNLRPTLFAAFVLLSLMAVGAAMRSRRAWLFVSIFNNLALLLFFKYARFVEANLNSLFAALHLHCKFASPSTLMPHGLTYILPVGISFFTFQSMSYTIDFYWGKVPRERNFLRFATFVCFFPQLMAGPIERARQILPQFQQSPPFAWQNIYDGGSLFLVGLFKKVALANYLALFVDLVYDNPARFDATWLALATFAFAWQIFFDFSGYTDMARGIAKVMGFDLVLNFNNPYLASGLGEFWTRWHISLSTWFRDYVYIPLGGNRRGAWMTYRNLLIVFLVSGFWHGAAWTYVIWGLLHALGIMLTRELERSKVYRERVPLLFKQMWVFLYVCFAWIFFRADSLADAWLILGRIATASWSSPQIPALILLLVLLAWGYQFIYESRVRPLLASGFVRVGLATSMLLYLTLCSASGKAFIYFQF